VLRHGAKKGVTAGTSCAIQTRYETIDAKKEIEIFL
jgi:hypothetical protein